MKTHFFKALIILMVFWVENQLNAQIQSVKYQIRYNTTTCLFDCCLIVHEGQARTPQQRAQFSSQFTVIVPAGSEVEIASNRNPIQSNQTYTGKLPATWLNGSTTLNPESLKGSDIYGFTPSLTPTSFYNNLNKGDTVVLFSLRINTLKECASGIRLFENGVDPGSGAPGLGGGDYSQGFTIGNTDQKFIENALTIYPPLPVVTEFSTSCQSGLEIQLEAKTGNCQAPLKYEWKGPGGFQSDKQDILLTNATPYMSGLYTVKVTDKFGCSKNLTINAKLKPDAGPDQYVKCYSTGAASVSAKGAGKWTLGSGSAGTAHIQNKENNKTQVYNFSNPGIYYLIWSDGSCQDTTIVNTGMNCGCGISANYVFLPENYNYCHGSGKDTLKGTEVNNTAGTYKWIYQFNNQAFVTASGTANAKNYILPTLPKGRHRWQRVFSKTSQPICQDTSNVIELNVHESPNAGRNDTLLCIKTDTATLNTDSEGFWYIGEGSAGTATLSSINGKNSKVYHFSAPGDYYIVRTNEVCNDTVVITLLDKCSCETAEIGDTLLWCVGESYQLKGNCPSGIWKSLSVDQTKLRLDSTVNGNANVHFTEKAMGIHKFVYSIPDKGNDTITVVIHTKPTVHLGEDFEYCNFGSSFIISASGADFYRWYDGSTLNNILVRPDSTSSYVVTGVNKYGCTDTDTLTVVILKKPNGNIPPVAPINELDSLVLRAGSWQNALEYRWLGPNNFTSNLPVAVIPSATSKHAGLYYLTVISPDDCYTYSKVEVKVVQRLLSPTLVDLKGNYQAEKKSNVLKWSTTMEVNCDRYVLERSSDGIQFTEIGYVKAAGISKSISNYQFVDDKLKLGVKYYYRLLQMGIDGKVSNERMISIESESGELKLTTLYPNPILSNMNLTFSEKSDETFSIEVLNTTGSVIWAKKIYGPEAGENVMSDFDPLQFKGGIYFIQVRSAHKSDKQRFVIIK
jgi:hypothetical protein